MSSLTNLAATITVAHLSSQANFGVYALAFAIYLIALGLSQAVGGNPLVIRFGAATPATQRQQVSGCLSIAAALAVLAVTSILALSFFVAHGKALLLAMAISMPGLLLQAAWRWQFFVERNSRRACAADAIWAVVQIAAFGGTVLFLPYRTHPWIFVFGWGLGATTSALYFSIRHKEWPKLSRGVAHIKGHRDLLSALSLESVAQAGTPQLTIFILAATLSFAAAGAIRGAQTLFGLVSAPLQGLSPVFMSYGATLQSRRSQAMPRYFAYIAAAGAATIAAFAGILYAAPARIGHLLLGRTWPAARSILLPVSIAFVLLWISSTAFNGLHLRAAVKKSLTVRVLGSVATLVAVLVGATFFHLRGAAWGLALSAAILSIMGWFFILRASGSATPPVSGPTDWGLAERPLRDLAQT